MRKWFGEDLSLDELKKIAKKYQRKSNRGLVLAVIIGVVLLLAFIGLIVAKQCMNHTCCDDDDDCYCDDDDCFDDDLDFEDEECDDNCSHE